MILPVFSLLMFEHSAFAKANSSDLVISEYIISMIDNEQVRTDSCVEEKAKVADICKSWSQAEETRKGNKS